jgi:hypothetical protein
MSLSRRGAGLLELLVAIAVAGLLAAETQLILGGAAVTLRERSERAGAEQAGRVALAAARAALEAAGRGTGGPDLLAAGPTGFTVRVTRAAGVVCDTAAGRLTVRFGAAWWSAVRSPVPGRDSLLVATPGDTGWQGFALQSAPASLLCPDGGPGLALPVGAASLARVAPGSPLRVVEPVELRSYSSPPDDWLGQRLVATTQPVQPLAGPLGPGGVRFAFETVLGATAAVPDQAAAVRVLLEVRSDRASGIGLARSRQRTDSVRSFILLVNTW